MTLKDSDKRLKKKIKNFKEIIQTLENTSLKIKHLKQKNKNKSKPWNLFFKIRFLSFLKEEKVSYKI